MSGKEDDDSPGDPGFNFAPVPIDLSQVPFAPANVATTNPEVAPTREGPPAAPATPLVSESYTPQLVEDNQPQSCLMDPSDMSRVNDISALSAPNPFLEDQSGTPITPRLSFEQLHKTEDESNDMSDRVPQHEIAIQPTVQDPGDGDPKTETVPFDTADVDVPENPSPQSNIFADVFEDEIFFEPFEFESGLGLESNLPFRVNSILDPPVTQVVTEKFTGSALPDASLHDHETSMHAQPQDLGPATTSSEKDIIILPIDPAGKLDAKPTPAFSEAIEPVHVDSTEGQPQTQQIPATAGQIRGMKNELEEQLAEAIAQRDEAVCEASELKRLLEQPEQSSQLQDEGNTIVENPANVSVVSTGDNKEVKDVFEEEPPAGIPEAAQQKSPETSVFLTAPSSPLEDPMYISEPPILTKAVASADKNTIQLSKRAAESTPAPTQQQPNTTFLTSERPDQETSQAISRPIERKRKRQGDALNEGRRLSFSKTGVSLRGTDPLPRRFAGNGLYGSKPKKPRSSICRN